MAKLKTKITVKEDNKEKKDKYEKPSKVVDRTGNRFLSQEEVLKKRSDTEKALFVSITKKFGEGLVGKASDIGHRKIPRFATGVFLLDVALGGGWAKGRINLVWGARSSCKTLLMLKMIAIAQQTDLITMKHVLEVENPRPVRVAYVDVEGALDLDWAEHIGVDLSQLFVVRPENAEQAAELVESFFASGVFDIVVLDSLAAMTPEKELDGEMGDSNMGVHAKINNQMFRKIQSCMNRLNNENPGLTPTFFVINQERQKLGVVFGSNKTKPGGLGQDFYTTMEVHTHARAMEYYDTEKSLPKACQFGFCTEKNKAGPARIEGLFKLAVVDDPNGEFMAGDVLEDGTVFHYAEKLSLTTKISESVWEMMGKTYKRKGDLLAEWFQDPANNRKLKRQILATLFPRQFADDDSQKAVEGRSAEKVPAEEHMPGVGSQDRIPA